MGDMGMSPQKDKMRAKLQDVCHKGVRPQKTESCTIATGISEVGRKGVRPQKDNARESPETV